LQLVYKFICRFQIALFEDALSGKIAQVGYSRFFGIPPYREKHLPKIGLMLSHRTFEHSPILGIGVMTPFVQLIWWVLISCFKEHRGLLKIEHTPRLCDYYIALVDKRCCGFQIHINKLDFAQRFLNAGTSCAANLVGLPNFGDTPRLANQSFNVTNNEVVRRR
jgi:hypothetical protein